MRRRSPSGRSRSCCALPVGDGRGVSSRPHAQSASATDDGIETALDLRASHYRIHLRSDCRPLLLSFSATAPSRRPDRVPRGSCNIPFGAIQVAGAARSSRSGLRHAVAGRRPGSAHRSWVGSAAVSRATTSIWSGSSSRRAARPSPRIAPRRSCSLPLSEAQAWSHCRGFATVSTTADRVRLARKRKSHLRRRALWVPMMSWYVAHIIERRRSAG